MISIDGADRRPQLGTLVLDIALTEELVLENNATQYPVEDGTLISDHITKGVERLRITGVVPAVDVLAFAGGPGAVHLADVVDTVRAIHDARELVEVATAQLLYTDMAFTNMRIARSAAEGGNFISIDAELVRIRKAALRTAEVPAEAKAAEPAKGRVGQTNTPAGKGTTAGGTNSTNGAPAEGRTLLRGLDTQAGGPLSEAAKGARAFLGR